MIHKSCLMTPGPSQFSAARIFSCLRVDSRPRLIIMKLSSSRYGLTLDNKKAELSGKTVIISGVSSKIARDPPH
jgi:hypothetical protein